MTASTLVLLIVALAYATLTDLKQRRIPNKLTFPIMLGGLALQTLNGGQSGLITSLSGVGVALAVTIVPFAMRWIGAGDAKLAMSVGALTGPDFVFASLLFAAVFAGAVAAGSIIYRRQLVSTAQYLFVAWRLPAPEGLALKGKLPYAPAMACGCAIALMAALLQGFRG